MSKVARVGVEVLEKGHLMTYFGEHYGFIVLPGSLSYWIGALVFIPALSFILRNGEWFSLHLAGAFARTNGFIATGWSTFLDGLIKVIQWMK